ncbi:MULTISPECIES: SpaH/EbpB family LPXTG-anchored major pilin [unclassified Leucobacter]|uniref:SpaH/EbpB family LPXTG-anchored major pilin n=1 Tax=unclassified Leucobacter TaxID=2621730 RepID=UPI00301B2246
MSRTTRRLSAAVAAVALGATALMGVAVSAASAAPSNIDPNQPRSLTIHKLSQPATPGVAGDGSELAPGSLPADALPINGIEFTVQQVTQIGGKPVDLTTDAGWATIQPYLNGTTPFVPGSATLGAPVKQVTANGGLAVFNTLSVGLFYVTETNTGSNSIKTPAQPFLVTLPMPTTEPGTFRYDVHAYPKNTLGDDPYTVKTVDDASAHAIGDKVTWRVSTKLPDSAGYQVSTYGVYEMPDLDSLARWDTNKVWSADDGTQFPDSATVTPKGGAPVPLHPEDLASSSSPGPITELSGSGLMKVNTAGPGSIIEFVYETRVLAIPANGKVRNEAEFAVNGINKFANAETLWGTARLNKHVQGDTAKRLAGAKFQVFTTQAAATAAAAQVTAGQPVTGGLTFGPGAGADADNKTFTTKDQGADHGFAVIGGLKASAAGTKYWVVETAAPAGYVASSTPTEITVYPGTDLSGAGATVNIANAQRTAGALPVLGGAGMTAIGIGGAILIAGGILFAIFGRRKKQQETPTPAA